MPDQDEYEPLARQWLNGYKRYIDDANSTYEEIADDALRVVTKMLRDCGGCSLLPQMTDLLWQYQLQLIQGNLFSEYSYEVLTQFNDRLDMLAKSVANRRIETVAIRSARTVAMQLQTGRVGVDDYSTLRYQIAAQVVKDLIRHSFLDKARAFSIGRRFPNETEAHQFYNCVLTSIDQGMESLVKQFIDRPHGERLRYSSPFFKKQSTRSMLFDRRFRMDI